MLRWKHDHAFHAPLLGRAGVTLVAARARVKTAAAGETHQVAKKSEQRKRHDQAARG